MDKVCILLVVSTCMYHDARFRESKIRNEVSTKIMKRKMIA